VPREERVSSRFWFLDHPPVAVASLALASSSSSSSSLSFSVPFKDALVRRNTSEEKHLFT